MEFLDGYNGETTDELIALADRHRIDSIIVAFDQAIGQKMCNGPASREEEIVYAIERLESAVNGGGFDSFFRYENEVAPTIVGALNEIGCPRTAEVTQRAIRALGIEGPLDSAKIADRFEELDDDVSEQLEEFDRDYFELQEPIADRLFDWIKRNREKIQIGRT
ncbi:MAG: DUF4375 domain-containing protein [Phycisphaerae bacterium]|nr:DUF4375 domain-containing protein [Phycisphaerae bacterium]